MKHLTRKALGASLVGLSLLAVTPSGEAVAYGGAPTRVRLGAGVYADRVASPCPFVLAYGVVAMGCFAWMPVGFELPPPQLGARVNMLASTASGRIVAALEHGGIVYTDDRGASWLQARVEGAASPRSLAFDDRGQMGAAVGTGGAWWWTDDDGASWRLRRDGGPVSDYVDVVVAGQSVMVSDASGGVYVSLDGGSSVRSLASRVRAAMPVMSTAEGAVWVRIEGREWWRASREGSLERRDRSPWG